MRRLAATTVLWAVTVCACDDAQRATRQDVALLREEIKALARSTSTDREADAAAVRDAFVPLAKQLAKLAESAPGAGAQWSEALGELRAVLAQLQAPTDPAAAQALGARVVALEAELRGQVAALKKDQELVFTALEKTADRIDLFLRAVRGLSGLPDGDGAGAPEPAAAKAAPPAPDAAPPATDSPAVSAPRDDSLLLALLGWNVLLTLALLVIVCMRRVAGRHRAMGSDAIDAHELAGLADDDDVFVIADDLFTRPRDATRTESPPAERERMRLPERDAAAAEDTVDGSEHASEDSPEDNPERDAEREAEIVAELQAELDPETRPAGGGGGNGSGTAAGEPAASTDAVAESSDPLQFVQTFDSADAPRFAAALRLRLASDPRVQQSPEPTVVIEGTQVRLSCRTAPALDDSARARFAAETARLAREFSER